MRNEQMGNVQSDPIAIIIFGVTGDLARRKLGYVSDNGVN